MTKEQIEKMEVEALDAWVDRIGVIEYIDDQHFGDGDTVSRQFNMMLFSTNTPIL